MKKLLFTILTLLISINITAQQWSSIIPNNIAQFKPTKQSSIHAIGHSNKAVDGNLDGNYNSRSVTHTQSEEGPWWEVNLLDEYEINSITIYNRTDCCPERLNNFSIIVSNKSNGAGTIFSSNTGFFRGNKTFNGNAKGQFVKIQLNGRNSLSLTEVVINGKLVAKKQKSNDNIALGKITRQSSVNLSAPSHFANDGDTNGDYNLGSVSLTKSDRQAFWEVDLGENYLVEKVVLARRTDAGQDKIKNFYIWVTREERSQNRDTEPFFELKTPLDENIKSFVSSVKRIGRYVRVELKDTDNLELAEVQVFGKEIGDIKETLNEENRFLYHVTAFTNLTSSEILISSQLATGITEGLDFNRTETSENVKYWEISAEVKASIKIFMATIEMSVRGTGGGRDTNTQSTSETNSLKQSRILTESNKIAVKPNTTIYKIVKFKIKEKPFIYNFKGKQYKYYRVIDKATPFGSTTVLEYPKNFNPGFVFDEEGRISQKNFDKIVSEYNSNNNSSNTSTSDTSNSNNNTSSNTTTNNSDDNFVDDIEILFYPSDGITLSKAKNIANNNGWKMATANQIQDAWEYYDLDITNCGLIQDGRISIPIQEQYLNFQSGTNIGIETEVQGFFYVK